MSQVFIETQNDNNQGKYRGLLNNVHWHSVRPCLKNLGLLEKLMASDRSIVVNLIIPGVYVPPARATAKGRRPWLPWTK